jgi:hypothetical protein
VYTSKPKAASPSSYTNCFDFCFFVFLVFGMQPALWQWQWHRQSGRHGALRRWLLIERFSGQNFLLRKRNLRMASPIYMGPKTSELLWAVTSSHRPISAFPCSGQEAVARVCDMVALREGRNFFNFLLKYLQN